MPSIPISPELAATILLAAPARFFTKEVYTYLGE